MGRDGVREMLAGRLDWYCGRWRGKAQKDLKDAGHSQLIFQVVLIGDSGVGKS
jgi:hypothetical protein